MFIKTALSHSFTTAFIIFILLASDILLPIPSSVVSTGAGFILGFPGGFAASWLGMTTACIIGYGLGSKSRQSLSNHLLGDEEIKKLENLNRRFGDWFIITTRAVPVLAEAAVIFAGIGSMPFPRFIIMTMLSNAAISAVYTAVGECSASSNSFLLAFTASILIPLTGMLLLRNKKKRPLDKERPL